MTLNKVNTDLLNSLSDNISDLFLVLDGSGNIIFFNKYAAETFGLKEQENIYDILDKDSSEKFNHLFQKVVSSNEREKSQLILRLNSGKELNSAIVLSPYRSKDEMLLFFTVKLQSYNISTGDVTNFQVKNEASEIINNPKIINIIEEIRSSYPFTFTSKERIRKLINEIDELFWMKNTDGVYVIANNKVASTIGLNFSQIEGKNETTFIPTYLINFHLLIDQYVRESSNCIIVEGIRLNGFSNSKKYQTVEIPLQDSENNVSAIICVGQKIKEEEKIILQQDFDLEDKNLISRGKLFEKLFQNNPLPVFIVDKESLKFIDVNQSASKLYGYNKNEFLTKDLTDLYSQEDIQTLLDSSVENLREGVFYGAYKHKKKNNSILLVEISKISVKFNGKDANLIIIKDATEKVQNEKNNQIYKASFENTSDLLFITDSSGFITFINEVVKDKLGYVPKDLENTPITALLHESLRARINNEIFKSQTIEPLDFELNLKDFEGNFVETNLKAVPIFNHKKEIESFAILAELKKTEMATEAENPAKKSESSHIVADSRNSGAGQVTLPNIFHEILTPINVILGFVQELTWNKQDLSLEQKEAVDMINHNRAILLNIMNSIIEYSNLEDKNAELQIEKIRITDIIDKLHDEFNELKGSREVEFAYGKISSSLEFQSDKYKFYHLVSLLLMMGVSVSKEKKIYLSAYQIDDCNFAVVIKDNYGFTSNKLLENFTSVFEQTDNIEKNFDISKYTLKLAKKLLSILHCERRILPAGNESKDNKELAFVFPIDLGGYIKKDNTIPESIEHEIKDNKAENKTDAIKSEENIDVDEINFEQEKFAAKSEGEIKTSSEVLVEDAAVNEYLDVSKLNCLYIEDQIDAQILFKVQMKELKKVKFALNFEHAVPMLDKELFDFIIIDINLPGDYNGLDALKIIHQSPGFEKIPIIAVSGYLAASEREKFIAAGFNDFISKPLLRDKLYASLSKVF